MRKFLSKFQPKRPENVAQKWLEEERKVAERRRDAFNKYTFISSNNGKPGHSKPLQFYINDGNNSNLIRRVM
jgi:hypothetical protein